MTNTHFVPIPSTEEALRRTSQHWLPFVPIYAKRSKESEDDILDAVISGRVQLGMIWDSDEGKAVAFVGVTYHKRGVDTVGDINIAAGMGVKEWGKLLSEIEQYLKEHQRCTVARPTCRPGWSPFLKEHGYKVTQYQMEKRL